MPTLIRALGSVAALLVATSGGIVAQPAEAVRLSTTIAGERAVIEVRNLTRPEAEQSIRSALGLIVETLDRLRPQGADSVIARLNAAGGQGPQLIDQDLLALLSKALGFCLWSQQAQGPLGGPLYDLWESTAQPPTPEMLRGPTQAAGCTNLGVRPDTLQASLAFGSRVDLRHFALGFAVDRAVEHLREAGATNLWVEIGPVVRALGAGASGRGWRFTPPRIAGMSEGLDPVWLRDLSLSVISAHRERFRFPSLTYPAYLDQRTGQPSSGVAAVLVATPLAVDAQALATTMMILGNREGQLRLGTVNPAPSALWLLGDGSGEPLLSTYKWSAVTSR